MQLKNKQQPKEKTMTKGEILISLVAGKIFCNEAILMQDENFVKEAKRLIKKGCYNMDQLVDKLVQWCNNNY